jgi:hypothetical protein
VANKVQALLDDKNLSLRKFRAANRLRVSRGDPPIVVSSKFRVELSVHDSIFMHCQKHFLDSSGIKRYQGSLEMHKSRQKLFVIVFVSSYVLLSTALGSESIPKQFWGVWMFSSSCKEFKKQRSEPEEILTITSNEVIGYEHHCKLRKLKSATSTQFKCAGEGEYWVAEFALSLKENKLYGASERGLVRCE